MSDWAWRTAHGGVHLFLLCLFMSLSAFSRAELLPVVAGDVPDTAQPKMESLGKLRPSFYWVAIEPKDKAQRTRKLFDEDAKLISAVSEKYYKSLLMEGTGRLANGKVINFKSRTKKSDGTWDIRWRVCPSTAPYGYGLNDIPLEAFKSVAVDTSVIPLGSKIYIPAAKGAQLPNGKRHDGYFTAVDIGDLIKNKKIDIFTAFGDQSDIFGAVGMETGRMVDIFLVGP